MKSHPDSPGGVWGVSSKAPRGGGPSSKRWTASRQAGASEAGRQLAAETAEVVEGTVEETLESSPDAVALADVGRLTASERLALETWLEAGGVLIRFAGPRLARGADSDDTLEFVTAALMKKLLHRPSVRLREAAGFGLPVRELDGSCRSATDYEALARECLDYARERRAVQDARPRTALASTPLDLTR